MDRDLAPEIYIVMRTIELNGVIIERDRYVANFKKFEYASAYVNDSNKIIKDAEKSLRGVTIAYRVGCFEK